MYYFIFLYLVPGIITTLLINRYIEAQGGAYYLESILDNYVDEYRGYLNGFMSFCPVINLISAVILIIWYVLEVVDKTNCGD